MVSFLARQIVSKTHKNRIISSLKEAFRLTLANGDQPLTTLNLRKSFSALLLNETVNCRRGFHTTVVNYDKSLDCPPPNNKKVWPCGIVPKKIIIPPPSRCGTNFYDPGIVPMICDEPGQFLTDNPNYKPQQPKKSSDCVKVKLPCCVAPHRHSCTGEDPNICGCKRQLPPTAAYSERLAIEVPSLVRCKECGPHYPLSCKIDRSVKFNCVVKPLKPRRLKNYIKPVIKDPTWDEMPRCKRVNICDDERQKPKRADDYMPKRPIKCLQPIFPHLKKLMSDAY